SPRGNKPAPLRSDSDRKHPGTRIGFSGMRNTVKLLSSLTSGSRVIRQRCCLSTWGTSVAQRLLVNLYFIRLTDNLPDETPRCLRHSASVKCTSRRLPAQQNGAHRLRVGAVLMTTQLLHFVAVSADKCL